MARQPVAVEVQGLREMVRELRLANANLPRELAAINKLVAEDIVGKEARRRAPFLNGDLRRSIRGLKQQSRGVVRMGGARVPYAGVQEFGWPARNITAQPFLYPAIAATRKETEEAYGDMLDDLLKRAFPQGRL